MSKRTFYRRGVIAWQVAMALAIALSAASPGLAKIRPFDPQKANSLIDPNPAGLNSTFGTGGLFDIGGGVIFQGRSKFFLQSGDRQVAVPTSTLSLTMGPDREVYVNYADSAAKRFSLDLHDGIACPLGKFVSREGFIAYTIPADMSNEARQRMRRAGLLAPNGDRIEDEEVSSTLSFLGRRKLAAEFANTKFMPLLHAADFADARDLPSDLEDTIISRLNASLGTDRSLSDRAIGSFVNTDQQVTYEVYLMLDTGRVETVGVPLRYHWKLAEDGSALVEEVQALSEPDPTDKLTDLSHLDREPPQHDLIGFLEAAEMFTQYDVISLFHAAGVFRGIYAANPRSFAEFVTRACVN